MNEILGADIPVFIGVMVVLAGGCGFMMGQALAGNWRPYWQVLFYSALLAAAGRFLEYALFSGQLLALVPFLAGYVAVLALASLGYRLTLADLMVRQYPWLYERADVFRWREKPSATDNLAAPPASH
ncbi:MAG: hypothetical protein K0S54_494 [Alphaproteobacteria bacterium]|jgi:hypothetical protein|nr:hypothetical protein [Alphaproteobacteria bacterium]